jgi:hypothetical protein
VRFMGVSGGCREGSSMAAGTEPGVSRAFIPAMIV